MFEKQFELRYFEMNKFGEATAATILTLLEETASEHCSSINQGLFSLFNENIGWVLVSGTLEMYRYPKHREKITIKTWLSQYSTIKGFRENIILDGSQKVIGKARGLWLFFDVVKRRPAAIYNTFINQWGINNEQALHNNLNTKIAVLDNVLAIDEFTIRKYDTDMYGHVNNIKYLNWVIGSIFALTAIIQLVKMILHKDAVTKFGEKK